MFEIKKYGSLWVVNEQGCFVPDAYIKNVQSPYIEAVNELVKSYLHHAEKHIHSIYIRGTVARGKAVYGVSDLDSYAITYDSISEQEREWITKEETRIANNHPCITGVQIGLLPLSMFEQNGKYRYMRFVAKTQSTCVYGEDIIPSIEPFRLDEPVLNFDISYIHIAIQKVLESIKVDSSIENVQLECHHLMKKIVRTGMSLVGLQERAYSRDLGYCYEFFTKVYPEKSNQMSKAVNWVIEPTGVVKELISYLNDFGEWMIHQANLWLEKYNPSREFEMVIA